MEDIVIGIGAKVLEYLVAPILDRARYLFCFKQFIGEIEEAKDELKTRLDEVKERKEQAARNSEEIILLVKNWLNDVEKILEEVRELQRKVEGEGKSCFNVSHRYSLAKQMDKKAKQMVQLKKDSHFDKDNFSRLTQIPGITYFSSKDFVDFNSRKSTSNHLLEAIKDGKNKIIGLYGMGGSGKTTLSKEVGKQVKDLKLFEKVVLVVVSKSPNVAKLQQELAEQIGFKFQDESQSVRAQRLSDSLKNEKILIILDDVWEYLSLEDIGIPLVEGCRILLTTRLRNVCVSMDCETIIELPLITKEEAWELFKKHANLYNDPSNKFDVVGRKIVDECKELPIAIVAVGSSLKGKPIEVWESALRKLKKFQPLNVEPGFRSPYACLKLSYDNLPSSSAKSLFLLCSMFPEDHEIHKEDLIRFGKGTLKLEESINTMEDVRGEILATLNILLDSCLLMSMDNQAHVKMHDLVRDVALWIAKEQGQTILVDSNLQSLKDAKTLSLWNLDENFKLSNQLHCPILDILLLQPHGFIEDFAGINALKVLALITCSFDWHFWWGTRLDCSLPRSTKLLKNHLHTLCLRGKRLGDSSFLGELKGLEVLDLRGSIFNELPAGIVDMKMLKLLDVFDCAIEKSNLEVIGRCEQLEELYLLDNKSTIPENFSLSRLKRYVICDSTCKLSYDYQERDSSLDYLDSLDGGNEEMRALWIQGFKVSTLNSSMQDLIHRANFLCLDDCRWDHNHINLFEIKHLWVYCCQEKRFIIDILQTQQVFSNLITLRLVDMNNLEQVFKDSCINHSLPMLQELSIQKCPQLRLEITKTPKLRRLEIVGCNKVKWLFSYSLASHCPSLEEIIIRNCSEFESLIDEEAVHGNPLLKDMKDHPYQPFILFPKLKEITMWGCNKVRCPLPYSLASHCPSLDKLEISSCSEIERLVDGEGDEEVAYGNQLLLKLKELFLFHLPKLREVFGYEYNVESHHDKQESPQHQVFSNLITLGLADMNNLVQVFKDSCISHSLPMLQELSMYSCPQLRTCIFTHAMITKTPKLRTLHIDGCNKVKWLFSYSLASHCPSLEEIVISLCSEFEWLIDEEAVRGDPLLTDMQQPIILFPKLKKIDIRYCNKVRCALPCSLVSHCPSLEGLYISTCSELERLVVGESDEEVAYANQLLLKLKELYLFHLPKLREVFGYEYKLDALRNKQESPQHKHENERVRVVNSELCDISLRDLPELECIWKGPTQIVSLHRLEDVRLRKCPRLRNIFTLATVTSLPELRTVGIDACNEWEGIFCEESLKNLYPTTICFPRLERIGIYRCQKVRRLFSYSLASHCPLLKEIIIRRCSQLKGVVQAYEGEAVSHDEKLFPELNYLYLARLPKLRDIYTGYEFNHLSGTIVIKGCPNIWNVPLEYKTSSDSEIQPEPDVIESEIEPEDDEL